MKSFIKLSVLVGFLVVSANTAEAQRFDAKKKYWSIGGSINAMNYVGDITGKKSRLSVPFKFTRQNIGICAVRRMTPRMSGRANFFYGRMASNDRNLPQYPVGSKEWGRYERGAAFVNTIYELSGTAIIDFYENRGTWQKRPDYTPYVFAGLGVIYHNPKTGPGGNFFKNYEHLGQGWSKVQGVLMYGAGFRYKLDKRWDLALEIGWRITTTDMLDGVEGEPWKDTDGWSAEEVEVYDGTSDFFGKVPGHNYTAISRPFPDSDFEDGTWRGDRPNDGYIITGLHLTRIIGGGVKCPKFR